MNIVYKGKRFQVAFLSDRGVVVNLPESMIYGSISRMEIPSGKLSPYQLRKMKGVVSQ